MTTPLPRPKALRMALWLVMFLGLLLAGPLLALALGRANVSGRLAQRVAPRRRVWRPTRRGHREAVVQVYASRAFSWRGAFADHMWLAAKAEGADRFTRYEVIGWYGGGGRSVVSASDQRAPDEEWFGVRAAPHPVMSAASDADAIIRKLPHAIDAYPYTSSYSVWPGPNSNTFIAHLGREIAELRVTLPSTAIGKDLPAHRSHRFKDAQRHRHSAVAVGPARCHRRPG